MTQWLMLVNIVSSGENIDSGLFPDRENIPEVALETSNWPIGGQASVSLTNERQLQPPSLPKCFL